MLNFLSKMIFSYGIHKFSKKEISATELQSQLAHEQYASIWTMMNKIRQDIRNRDASYIMSDMVELDEGCFESEICKESSTNLKRGRGSENK